jgi:hypothetical protein
MTKEALITALAPAPEPFDPDWSRAMLSRIASVEPAVAPRPRRGRRLALVGLAAGTLSLGTVAAVAAGGPEEVVKQVLTRFGEQPNTTGNGIGELDDPLLVAQFDTEHGVFAFWVATSSEDGVCFAVSDGQWNGEGSPTEDQLTSYGCGGDIYVGPGRPPEELTRPDQLGGFFKDEEPLVYGVSPYPDAVSVRVRGLGVDRTLPVRPDSHGYGAALPEAAAARALTLTFLDGNGRVLGSERSIAPAD